MKFLRTAFLLTLLVIVAALSGCGGPKYAPIHLVLYIDGDCRMETWDGDEVDEIVAFPGDMIVFVNKSTSDKRIDFSSGGVTPFDSMTFTIEPNHRAKMRVRTAARGGFDFQFNCTSPTGGTPKVTVGDPP